LLGDVYYSMYVTDKVDLSYHPFVGLKSIVEKYYPLEIEREQSNLLGFVERFTIMHLKVKK